jgi:hypothetical protein
MRQLNNIPELLEGDFVSRFRINDIELHVPPTAISIHKEGLEYSWKTLRSKVSTKIPSGNGTFHVQVSITFPADSLILLHRLIAQVRNNPFVPIENNFISQSISISNSIINQANFFTVFGLNISNHPSSPGAFVVELDLRYFNHKPYGNSLLYKKDFVHKVASGFKINHYVHPTFPGIDRPATAAVLKKTETITSNNSSTRTNIKAKMWGGDFSTSSMSTGLQARASDSDAFKRYGNYLQLKYLHESFGITIFPERARFGENGWWDPMDVFTIVISNNIYDLLQGVGDKVLGLHEIRYSANAAADPELLTLRRKLTNAILVSGLNTRIVIKEYVSLNLDGNFLFRYRKTLHKDTKGLNEAERQNKIKQNRAYIFSLFGNASSTSASPSASATSRSVSTASAPAGEVVEDSSFRLEIKNKERNYTDVYPLSSGSVGWDLNEHSPGIDVRMKKDDHSGSFMTWNYSNKGTPDEGTLAAPVFSMIKGKITYKDDSIIITDAGIFSTSYVEYQDVFFSTELKNAINEEEIPAGTIIGWFPLGNLIWISFDPATEAEILPKLRESDSSAKPTESKVTGALQTLDMIDSYLGNPILAATIDVAKSVAGAVTTELGNQKTRSALSKTLLTLEDKKYIDKIKKHTDGTGWTPYVYRSGLENVFQKALMLSFDSNYTESDIFNITGIESENLNVDVLPKFEQDITSVSCALRNIISSIPILGHEYPTHQFLGSIEPVFQFNFIGKSHTDGLPDKIKELENIRAHTAYMAKNFPQIPDAGNIIVESLITKLVGSFKLRDLDEQAILADVAAYSAANAIIRESKPRFIISSSNTFTIEGSPQAVGLNLRFSESKPYDEEEVREAKSSGIEQHYLKRYAALIQQESIETGDSSSPEFGTPISHTTKASYSTARYVPYNWNTRYFGAAVWYGAAKRHVKRAIKKTSRREVVNEKIDKLSFEFCKYFLDPLQDFLSAYSKVRSGKKDFHLSVFSTLDMPASAGSRKTKSNHFAGVAVDFKINDMNAMEACAIIEMLEERRFFTDVFAEGRNRYFGMGIYGIDADLGHDNTDATTVTLDALMTSDATMSIKKRKSGFIHLDANFNINSDMIKKGKFTFKDQRRRWVGKSGDDAFQMFDYRENITNLWRATNPAYFADSDPANDINLEHIIIPANNGSPAWTVGQELEKRNNKKNQALFWNNTRGIKAIKSLIEDTFIEALENPVEPDVPVEPGVDVVDPLDELTDEQAEEIDTVVEDDDEEGVIANTTSGQRSDNREPTEEKKHKIDSTNIKSFMQFLNTNKRELNLSDEDIRKALIRKKATTAGYYDVPMYRIGSNEYNQYEVTFLPHPGKSAPTEAQLKVLQALRRYYSRELLVGDTKIVHHKKNPPTGFTVRPSKSKRYTHSTFTTGTPSKATDATKKQLLLNNKMLKSFTELASVLLTEPYLYTNTKVELAAELKFIEDQLYGFKVLPCFYNVIEKAFTGSAHLEITNFEELNTSRSTGTAVGFGVGVALTYAAALSNPVSATLIGVEVLGVLASLYTGLDGDAEQQLERVRHGLRLGAEYLKKTNAGYLSYLDYFKDNKTDILGDSFKLDSTKAGDFLTEMGNADSVASGIGNYSKAIYAELSVFKTFNKVGTELSAQSSALGLIKQTMKDNTAIVDAEGKIDENLANFALAERITMESLRAYLKYLFLFPRFVDKHIKKLSWTEYFSANKEEDATNIYDIIHKKNWKTKLASQEYEYLSPDDSDEEDYYEFVGSDINSGSRIYLKGTRSMLGISNKDLIKRFGIGRIPLGLKDFKTYPFLITSQMNKNPMGAQTFFNVAQTKEQLKTQQRNKLAYLKRLLDAILSENMALNPERVIASKDTELLRVLDSSSVFELLEENAYPDIDLPQDPKNPYNNSNLSPCFYYHDQNDHLDVLMADRKTKEFNAANKIMESSIQFQKGLRAGIFTGPEQKLTKDKQQVILNSIEDSTEILRTVSDFLISDSTDATPGNKTPAYLAPIRIGLFSKTKEMTSETPISITVPVESAATGGVLANIEEAVAARVIAGEPPVTSDASYDNVKKEFNSLSTAFGSNLGYKARDLFLKQADESGDKKLKRTMGIEPQQQYGKDEILDLCEDSSTNINKLRTIKEAFPTFRLYIIEEDEIYTDRLTAFDDFFYYNSVISFNTHSSRELAASIATIQLQNISGLLDGTKKRSLRDVDISPDADEEVLDQKNKSIDSIVLRPGVTVQLRAGYESNTNQLDVLISGKITDINYAKNNTICNLTVQSFGVELEALRKGQEGADAPSVFYSTHQLLGSMMMSDELKHFGRSKVGAVFQVGEYQDASLDLNLYKRESSFTFSMSRTVFDFVREHSFGIGVGIGVLSLGLPALRMAGGMKHIRKIGTFFKANTPRLHAVTSTVFRWVAKPVSWVAPFGNSNASKNMIIKQARALEGMALKQRNYAGGVSIIRTFDDALDYLVQAHGLGRNAMNGGLGGRYALATLSGGLNSVLQGQRNLAINQAAHGYVNGTVVHMFRKIANFFSGKVNVTSELGDKFLRNVILKHKGFGALGLQGMSASKMSAAVLAGRIGGGGLLTAWASISLPLAIGFTGLVTGAMLAAIDVAVDSAVWLWRSLLGSYTEDKNKLKKIKYLSPQDDNIFAPHPYQYMKNIPAKSEYNSYSNGLLNGWDYFTNNFWRTGKQILNISTYGLLNVGSSTTLKTLQINPFKLIDKRLDIAKFENPFILTGQTIWQVLHECTLRHPGYIYGVRPYGNSLEYRVFFGVPSQRYWSKKITNSEIRKLNGIYEELKALNSDDFLSADAIKLLFPNAYIQYSKDPSYGEATSSSQLRQFFTEKAYEYYIEKTKDRFVPFRQFHLVSSSRNLVANNIIISAHNMTNAVSVSFLNNIDNHQVNSSLLPALTKYGESMETLKFRANNNISMGTLKEKAVTYRNVVGPSNAIRYGLGELLYGTRKMYEGSLTILGDTKINPWDVVLLHDNITNMHGPVEVCSVSHMFSFETGFVTDIEVNALVTSNEELTHPVVSQNLVYETRSRVFDEYNSIHALGNTAGQRETNVKRIVKEEVEKMIESNMVKDAGVLRKSFGAGLSLDFNSLSDAKRKKLVDKITELTLAGYDEGSPGFLRDFVPGDSTIPQEITDLVTPIGGVAAGITGAYFAGETFRRHLLKRSSLSLMGGGLWKMGLFFASSIAAANSGDTINDLVSTSYNSGLLGKNMFRQHILSRMEQGNIIQLYPLVKDGLPLVTGGFEEVDESEKWNNMLGYIYNSSSSAVKGYLDRQQELKAYGNKVIEAYDKGELDSFRSAVTVNANKLLEKIGIVKDQSLLGYLFKD